MNWNQKATKTLGYFIFEAVIIFAYIFILNNYIGRSDSTINADGIGYYDYLPSTFIHKDINRNDEPLSQNNDVYNRVKQIGGYVQFEDRLVNKYPVGTAILQSPFFLVSWVSQDNWREMTGFEKAFHKTIFDAAIFYLFLTLILFKFLLLSFKVERYKIIILQVFMVLATSITHYASEAAAFSHIYSLFAMTLYLLLIQKYSATDRFVYFYWSCLVLGLLIVLRYTNIMVILFVPFILSDYAQLKRSLRRLVSSYTHLPIGVLLGFVFIFIQMYVWYLQTGHWLVYSYGDETFNFDSPEIINVLFSYNRGLFVYTPILFLSVVGVVTLIMKGEVYKALTWIIPMFLVTYVISSWWCWNYGDSFGMRPFIEYFSLFFLLMGIALKKVKITSMSIITLVVSPLIFLNIVQSYQYRKFILHWTKMDEQKYWSVFLKTDLSYNGWLWKRNYDYSKYDLVEKRLLGDYTVKSNETILLFEIPCTGIENFDRVSIIQMRLENDYLDGNDSHFIMEIRNLETYESFFYHKLYLGHLAIDEHNKLHKGRFDWEFNPTEGLDDYTIVITFYGDHNENTLKEVELNFLSLNKNPK